MQISNVFPVSLDSLCNWFAVDFFKPSPKDWMLASDYSVFSKKKCSLCFLFLDIEGISKMKHYFVLK